VLVDSLKVLDPNRPIREATNLRRSLLMSDFPESDQIAFIRKSPLWADTVAKVESCRATIFSRNYQAGSDRRFV
jgi:hypothetical protein